VRVAFITPRDKKKMEDHIPGSDWLVRVATGVQEPPRVDPERFLSMIQFPTRQKLDDLPDFQLDA
jgi:hypothetical protein